MISDVERLVTTYLPMIEDEGDAYALMCPRCGAVARNMSRTDGRVFPRTGPRPVSDDALKCLKCGLHITTKEYEDSIAYHETRPWPGESLWAEFWNYYKARPDAIKRKSSCSFK